MTNHAGLLADSLMALPARMAQGLFAPAEQRCWPAYRLATDSQPVLEAQPAGAARPRYFPALDRQAEAELLPAWLGKQSAQALPPVVRQAASVLARRVNAPLVVLPPADVATASLCALPRW